MEFYQTRGDDLREVVQKLVFGPNVMVQTSHMAEVVGDFFLRFVFF